MGVIRRSVGRGLRRIGLAMNEEFTPTQIAQLRAVLDKSNAPAPSVADSGAAPAPLDVLDFYASGPPDAQATVDLFAGEWSSKFPAPLDHVRAGDSPLFAAEMITWGVEALGGVKGLRVLEIGPLEGGHTYMLDRLGAAEVVAVEANSRAYLKCLVAKELLDIPSARFLYGDGIAYMQRQINSGAAPFDFCLASGVLYHMTNPVAALKAMTSMSDNLLMWTMYWDDDVMTSHPELAKKFPGATPAIEDGFPHTLYKQEYQQALDFKGFCGGTAAGSAWLSRADILAALKHFGFDIVDTGFEGDNGFGACFAVAVDVVHCHQTSDRNDVKSHSALTGLSRCCRGASHPRDNRPLPSVRSATVQLNRLAMRGAMHRGSRGCRTRLFAAIAALFAAITLVACSSNGSNRFKTQISISQGTEQPFEPVVMHLDAHDGGLTQFQGTFFVYGTSYNCGFEFGILGTRFCGISIYSSTNLRDWQLVGLAFNAQRADWQSACSPGGCFRPHVIFNRRQRLYVMWINVFTGAYRVLTSPTPTGPWTLRSSAVALPTASGDENLLVDQDGTGYLIRTDLVGMQSTTKSHELEVNQLDNSYLNLSGRSSRPQVGFVEAPMMWRRAGHYYLAYSDPACPYCPGTGTSVLTARSPLGPWSAPYSISPTSCGGQPTQVSTIVYRGSTLDIYQSDQWVRLGSDAITRNQGSATQAWAPLKYDKAGKVSTVSCPGR